MTEVANTARSSVTGRFAWRAIESVPRLGSRSGFSANGRQAPRQCELGRRILHQGGHAHGDDNTHGSAVEARLRCSSKIPRIPRSHPCRERSRHINIVREDPFYAAQRRWMGRRVLVRLRFRGRASGLNVVKLHTYTKLNLGVRQRWKTVSFLKNIGKRTAALL
jgi:hypothetical protein